MDTEKLTAVEWLFYRMIMDKTLSEKADFMHEAKEMEKDEKIEFACQVAEASAMKYIQGKTTRMIAEELLNNKSE